MDGISAAASVIAVVQISRQIFQLCQTYYLEVKNAKNDTQRLRNEVMALRGVASSVNDLVATAESNKLPALEFLNQNHGLLQHYQLELGNLAVRLEKALGKDKMKRLGMKALKWPFDKKEADDAVAVIERCKTTFNLALGCDQAYVELFYPTELVNIMFICDLFMLPPISSVDCNFSNLVLAIDHGVTDLKAQVTAYQADEQSTKISGWLSTTDPSSNYETARKKCQPKTGEWLFKRPEFEEWKEKPNSLLWLYGKRKYYLFF